MIATKGYAAPTAKATLSPFNFERREPGPFDVVIDIVYCGVCHSDIHQARDEWGGSIFPMVPGHEIVGRVARTGEKVTKLKAGDLAAVGCMVDSCRKCHSCREGLEQFCEEGAVLTYNSVERETKAPTYGGYSSVIVVDEAFTLSVPANLEPAGVAPLLCAGITTYSPLRHWNVGPGQKVGVVGLGGLGHMGVKFAAAFGAEVYVITTSERKRSDALRFGATDVILSTRPESMTSHARSFDFILDTVAGTHDQNALLTMLKRDATLALVGVPEKPAPIHPFPLIMGRRRVAGSLIGGIAETQEMLSFCGEKGIAADVEIIPVQMINEAYERMIRGDVRYRFVIDMATL